jgi:hypothetical protein
MKWFPVYPGSEKLDLGPEQYVAIFAYEEHAKQFAERWAPYGYIEPITLLNATRTCHGESR